MQEFFITSLSHTLHFDFEEMQYFYLKINQKQAYEALKKQAYIVQVNCILTDSKLWHTSNKNICRSSAVCEAKCTPKTQLEVALK